MLYIPEQTNHTLPQFAITIDESCPKSFHNNIPPTVARIARIPFSSSLRNQVTRFLFPPRHLFPPNPKYHSSTFTVAANGLSLSQ